MIVRQCIRDVNASTFESVVKEEMEKGFYLHAITVTQWSNDINHVQNAVTMILVFNKEQQ